MNQDIAIYAGIGATLGLLVGYAWGKFLQSEAKTKTSIKNFSKMKLNGGASSLNTLHY